MGSGNWGKTSYCPANQLAGFPPIIESGVWGAVKEGIDKVSSEGEMMDMGYSLEYLKALVRTNGTLAGAGSKHLCDLSGKCVGRLTATDVVDQLAADAGFLISAEDVPEILNAYEFAYNVAAASTLENEDV